MRHRLTSLALLATLTSAHADTPKSFAPRVPAVAPFSARLDGALAQRSGNFLYSPTSISIALAMVREGARGATADEMDRVLGADARTTAKAITRSFKTSKHGPGETKPPELAIANRLFGDLKTTFAQPFLDVTSKDYEAPVESLDFFAHADASRLHINAWVATQTHDKIKDLLPPPSVTPITRLVLVNAIYMKAAWAMPFQPSLTAPAAFNVGGAASKQVPTMHTTAVATWGAHAGARMLDLPYASAGGTQLSMMLVVPDVAALATVEKSYASEGIQPFLAAVKTSGPANVALPKFEVGTAFELEPTLVDLGMKVAFSDHADFSGISQVPTQISRVIHKAWAKVDEAGTEAAAATAIVVNEVSGGAVAKPHPFAVDRSFLFFVHDAQGNVLFGGRIVDPSAN
ncbi:serpin family protein [soil metagenome]